MSIYDPRIVDRLKKQATAHKDFLDGHGIEYVGEGNIGFSEDEQKWYGWSHRGRCGFEIGDEIEDGDLTGGLPVGFKAKTLDDAKEMAVAFADAVSHPLSMKKQAQEPPIMDATDAFELVWTMVNDGLYFDNVWETREEWTEVLNMDPADMEAFANYYDTEISHIVSEAQLGMENKVRAFLDSLNLPGERSAPPGYEPLIEGEE